MTLTQLIEKMLDDAAAANNMSRTDMDNTLVFEAAKLEDHCVALSKKIEELEGQNASLHKDATEKLTQAMKNQEILQRDCEKLACSLAIETTKVAYLGKLVQIHRSKDAEIDGEEWATSCSVAANLLAPLMANETATIDELREGIKLAGTILVGGVPEASKILKD